ncbi:MAG: glycosyltransferase family 2 protein [Acidobacteriia bacterium]|nr:glycosyltransferase family 2 protein [Terriglobia bacterium]
MQNRLEVLRSRVDGRIPAIPARIGEPGKWAIIGLRLRRSVSIVIPAYNEEKRLPVTLKTVLAYLDTTPWDFAEVVVVDDGSRDGTAKVARGAGVRVVGNPGYRGKGYSVRHGMLEARGEWVLFTDADLSAPIEELEKLWSAMERESAQVAVGSRAVDRSLVGVHQPFLREAMGRLFNLWMRLITGLPFHDTQCGFKLFETGAAREIFGRQLLDGFGFDVEVLFIAQRLGYRALEVPVRWNDVAGTKVSLWRGMMAFLDPLRVRWNGLMGKYR